MNINDIRDIEKPVLKRSLISIQIFYVSAAFISYAYLYLLLASTLEHSECIPGTRPEPLNHRPKTEGGVMQPLILQNAVHAPSVYKMHWLRVHIPLNIQTAQDWIAEFHT